MRKILFLFLPARFLADSASVRPNAKASLPYGVLSMATYLKKYAKSSVDIRVLDLNAQSSTRDEMVEEVRAVLSDFNPDIVGLSALFNTAYPLVEPLTRAVKQFNGSIVTIVGGAVGSNLYTEILSEAPSLDAACYSEGEIPLLELVESGNLLETLEHHPSFITQKTLAAGKKPLAKFVENLDDIPLLDLSMVDISKYVSQWGDDASGEVSLSIHTSRGCPFKCVFCSAPSLHGSQMRYMSTARVLSDVKKMVDDFGMTSLSVMDDQFLINKNRAKQILRGLADLNISVEFASGLSVAYIDEEMAALMKRAGAKAAVLAIESGSDFVLRELINKPLALKQVKPVVAALKKEGLFIFAFFVTGIPGETEKDRLETLKLIYEAEIDWAVFVIATPFKGSELYEICMENDYIDAKSITEADVYSGTINTPDMSAEYITKRTYLMNLEANFVNNANIRNGSFSNIVGYLEQIVAKHPRHAFVHRALAIAYEGLNKDKNLIEKHKTTYAQIIGSDPMWREYAEHFHL